jgi:hypothetical protein
VDADTTAATAALTTAQLTCSERNPRRC